MFSKLPIVSQEMVSYFKRLLGDKLADKYLQKVSTPIEEYSLHIYKDTALIEEIIEKFDEKGFKATVHKQFPNLIISEPKGPFVIDSSREAKEIVVDEKAAEMIYQGADVFVPGVKRANKVKTGDLVDVVNQQGLHVSKAQALMSHNEILTKKKGIAAKNIHSPYVVPSIDQLKIDHLPVYFQSFPAYLASLNLEPKENDAILDCCSAPGNKTIHLSELTNDKARIVATDRSTNRIKKLKEKIEKFRIKNVKLQVGNIIELSKKWNIKFDKILIDPPCTNLGVRPKLMIDTDTKTINSSSTYQKAIFYACNNLLKTNGEVVYSTCTITKEENEEFINYAEDSSKIFTWETQYSRIFYS
ncbi:MAG: PUA domain-containing protein [Candidatus Heimdallarchaeaceae archaeon]|jgi:predicted RNA-binding protein (TIGR00451 family)